MGAMASDQFISEPVEVTFHEPPALEKTPPCPAAFTWREERHVIAELLAESHSFERRGKMSRNMRPTNLAVAASRGSWGVGRFSFREIYESASKTSAILVIVSLIVFKAP